MVPKVFPGSTRDAQVITRGTKGTSGIIAVSTKAPDGHHQQIMVPKVITVGTKGALSPHWQHKGCSGSLLVAQGDPSTIADGTKGV